MLIEANIDALVGPTHHFGGLGVGNVASIEHRSQASYPKKAALEGLSKAALIARLGAPQYVWLPPVRPDLELLGQLGFGGSLREQLEAAYELEPRILSAVYSSSFMWAANAATISPAADATDGFHHVTPANLISSWHRGCEARQRQGDLQQTLGALPKTIIHQPLPGIVPLRDEGAANHMRLCDPSGEIGLHIFVYGEDDPQSGGSGSKDSTSGVSPLSRFMPRQTLAACKAIARRHCLRPDRTFFLQQHPAAISAGVFHNDVIATSHQGLLIHHELAFADATAELLRLEQTFQALTGQALVRWEVPQNAMPLDDAVQSYFFNSQIISTVRSGEAGMTLVCPSACEQMGSAQRLIRELLDAELVPIHDVRFVKLTESMANGGGPACLRLRWPMSQSDYRGLRCAHHLTPELEGRLASAIERLYPDCIEFADLANADFALSSIRAAEEFAADIRRRSGASGRKPPGRAAR